jgi:divalent metal cation (Fe/Co/Zn/Cd) transporter
VTAQRWVRLGFRLVLLTALYNAVEALVALWAAARAVSIALVGFGLDSVIELAASAAVIARMLVEARGAPLARVVAAEHRVRRFVGWTLVLLGLYVVGQAGLALWRHEEPRESLVGVVLAAVSLVVMPLIAWGKFRVAARVASRALGAEAMETLACAYLSFCLLLGLGLHAALGWWWADPVAALLMVPWLLREGREALEQEVGDDDRAHA